MSPQRAACSLSSSFFFSSSTSLIASCAGTKNIDVEIAQNEVPHWFHDMRQTLEKGTAPGMLTELRDKGLKVLYSVSSLRRISIQAINLQPQNFTPQVMYLLSPKYVGSFLLSFRAFSCGFSTRDRSRSHLSCRSCPRPWGC